MNYLAKVDQTYTTKNRLELAVSKFILSLDRQLVKESQLPKFKKEVEAGINKLNTEFPRCTPITMYWNEFGGVDKHVDIGLHLHPANLVTFRLYQIVNGNYIPAEHFEQPVQTTLS